MEHLKSFKVFESVTKNVLDDRIEYHNDEGQLHRVDGPAIEWIDGGKEWWLNDKRHREDGPAVEWDNGSKVWYLNGKLHREDGPAAEYDNGDKEWYLNDTLVYEYAFIQKLTNQKPNPNLFKDLPIEDLEEISNDLCDKYLGEIKKWHNFYAIYFKEKLDMNDPDLKSFKNRMGDFRIRINNKSILIYQ